MTGSEALLQEYLVTEELLDGFLNKASERPEVARRTVRAMLNLRAPVGVVGMGVLN